VPATPTAHAGAVPEQTSTELRATAAESARHARGVLAELADPTSELTATAATRHWLEVAALGLEALVATPTDTGARSAR
jgi:carbon starvation protein CstA